MAELSLDTIRESIAACNKNILKIRKYIRDNQASLTAHSTNQLNKICKDLLPVGMQLKRNYGHLALRSVGGGAKRAPVKENVKEPEGEYEYEYEEEVNEPPRRSQERPRRSASRPVERPSRCQSLTGACNACPPREDEDPYDEQPQYNDSYMNYNTMSNADLARQCFMPAAIARYRNRQWG